MTEYINLLYRIKCPTCDAAFDLDTIDVRVRYAADNEYSQCYDLDVKCQSCKTVWYHAEAIE